MDLSPRQLSSLKTMGIPVWEFRSSSSSELGAVEELSQALIEQLSQCNCWILIEPEFDAQKNTLLHAMLFAIGLTATDFAVIHPHHFYQVQQLNIGKKVILSLGELVMDKLPEQAVSHGELVILNDVSLLMSHSLAELISKPSLKAEAWKHLRLVKNELLSC